MKSTDSITFKVNPQVKLELQSEANNSNRSLSNYIKNIIEKRKQ